MNEFLHTFLESEYSYCGFRATGRYHGHTQSGDRIDSQWTSLGNYESDQNLFVGSDFFKFSQAIFLYSTVNGLIRSSSSVDQKLRTFMGFSLLLGHSLCTTF